MIRLTPQAPLVGFHGMATEEGLSSLGLILLDNMDAMCSWTSSSQEEAMKALKPFNEVERDQMVEGSISVEE